ncbi:MAG: tripartite tricarboxylate transporter permease [archaeon]
MIDYVLYALLGIAFGCVTGLTPGLHINTVSLVALSLFYSYSLDPMNLSVFIVSMGITHSFVDFIPSVFLGVPDSNTVLSIQPGHRMLLRGRGYEAVVLSVAGGLFGIVVMVFLFGLLLFAVPVMYSVVKSVIPLLLAVTVLYMIVIDKNPFFAAVVTLFAATYGIILMDTHVINRKYTLFVMLTGLFAVSSLVLSYKTVSRLPPQKLVFRLKARESVIGSFAGFLGGIVAGVLPGLGSSQSAILVQKLGRIRGMKVFVVALGTINTIAIIMSVMSLYMIGRARSGSAVVIGEIMPELSLDNVYLFLGVALFSTGLSALLTIRFGKLAAKHVHRVNYRKMVLAVIVALIFVTFAYTGFPGLLICAAGTVIGVLPNIFGTKKSLLLNCLIAPTILYLTGMDYVVLRLIGL